jgi:DNA-binding NarL/FixJ family response regulator
VIRVVIADDQALVRGGFRLILATQPDLEVVAEAADGEEALAAVRRLRPDVALVDIRMPPPDGLEVTRRLAADSVSTRIIVLTTFDLDAYVYEALGAGASGFLLKDVRPEDLVAAVRAVVRGETLLAPAVTQRLVREFLRRGQPETHRQPVELASLTAREREVLVLVARGLSNAEIAAALVLAETTVKTHIGAILRKLGLRDRVQAVVLAYRCGLVDANRAS